MSKLLKSLSTLVIVLLAASIVVGIIGWFNLPSILSSKLTNRFKVQVNVGNLMLNWNKFGLEDFSISNPKGSIISTALKVGSAAAYAPLTRYLSSDIVVDEILIKDVYIGLEFNSATGSDGNWTVLINNLLNARKTTSEGNKREATRNILIKRVVIENINTDVVFKGSKNPSVNHLKTIDKLEFKNISSSGGFPIDQIMNSVLGQMLESIFLKENLKNMLDSVWKNPSKAIDDLINPFKGLLNQTDNTSSSDLLIA